MKLLSDFNEYIINEGFFEKKDFDHRGDFKYIQQLIDKLINGDEIQYSLIKTKGKITHEKFSYKFSDEQIKLLNDFKDTCNPLHKKFNHNITPQDFNNFIHSDSFKDAFENVKGADKFIWNNIYKSDNNFTKVNAGNEFENIFLHILKEGENDITGESLSDINKEVLNNFCKKFSISKIISSSSVGSKNNKRKEISFSDIKDKPDNIGEVVSDIDLQTVINEKEENLHLSLKDGSYFQICNVGLTSYIGSSTCKSLDDITDTVDKESNNIVDAKNIVRDLLGIDDNGERIKKVDSNKTRLRAFFDVFGLDPVKFFLTYLSYKQNKIAVSLQKDSPFNGKVRSNEMVIDLFKSDNESEQIDNEKAKLITNFILQCFGTGYILVHRKHAKDANGYEFADLRSYKGLKEYLTGTDENFRILSGKAIYSDVGDKKHVEIIYTTKKLEFSVKFRDNAGKIAPRVLQISYKEHK